MVRLTSVSEEVKGWDAAEEDEEGVSNKADSDSCTRAEVAICSTLVSLDVASVVGAAAAAACTGSIAGRREDPRCGVAVLASRALCLMGVLSTAFSWSSASCDAALVAVRTLLGRGLSREEEAVAAVVSLSSLALRLRRVIPFTRFAAGRGGKQRACMPSTSQMFSGMPSQPTGEAMGQGFMSSITCPPLVLLVYEVNVDKGKRT